MLKSTHLTERKNRFVVNCELDKSLGPGINFLFLGSNRHFPAIKLSAGVFTEEWCPIYVPFFKRLSALVLLFREYKGREADSKSVGKILAGKDVQNSTLGCKTSSKEQISSKTQGFKKLSNCLFGLCIVNEPQEKAGSFQLPQVWQALHRPFLIYN